MTQKEATKFSYPHVISTDSGPWRTLQSKFMHYPFSFISPWGFSHVEDQCLLESNDNVVVFDRFVSSSCLPESISSSSIGSCPVFILSLSWGKKVPFILTKRLILFCALLIQNHHCINHPKKKNRSTLPDSIIWNTE